MEWAVVTHPDHIKPLPNGQFVLMVPPLQIAEHCLLAATGQGWVVLARDSDVYPGWQSIGQPKKHGAA